MSGSRMVAVPRRTAALLRYGGLDPTLVLTMGKVGTHTLRLSAEARGHRAAAGHFATANGVRRLVRWRDANDPGDGSEAVRDLGFSSYFRLLRARPGRGPLRVLTGVREPVAHSISLFFQVGIGAGFLSSGSAASTDLSAVSERFLTFHRSGGVPGMTVSAGQDWFADEFQPATGLDVYAQPFPLEASHVRLRGTGFDVLLIRAEDLAHSGEEILDDFLGPAPDPTRRADNVGESKRYGDLYRAFLAEVVLPADLVEEAYETRLACHFYSRAERERFFRGWTGA